MRRGIVSAAAALAVCLLSTSAHAVVSKLDSFEIRKNGVTSFLDEFSDGVVPAAPGWAINLGSVPVGSEANSLLTLDSANGGATVDALGRARKAVVFSRATPVNQNGLASDDDIQITGVFELLSPTGPLFNAYGIRVAEAGAAKPRVAQLHVEYNPTTGAPTIRYILQDFAAGTITSLGAATLAPDAGADRILLTLSRSAQSNQFVAAYAFGSNGSFGDAVGLGAGATLFVNSQFVRGQVITVTAVPEPATWLMMGLGIAGLGAAVRRRQAA